MSRRDLEDLIARLDSIDANDRVKAAAELGEVGTPAVAPKVLKAAWEDEASTVRQMAIQSYFEILGSEASSEIIRAAETHFDDYVKIYAISVMGSIDSKIVTEPLSNLLKSENPKIRAATLRAMLHANTVKNVDQVYHNLKVEKNPLAIKSSIEALTVWRYNAAKDTISKFLDEPFNKEIKTISLFALASFGSKMAKKGLENDNIDELIRVRINKKTFRGREGLLEALKFLE